MDIKKRIASFNPAPLVPPASKLASTTALHIAHCANDCTVDKTEINKTKNILITIFSLFFLGVYTQPLIP